MKKIIKIGILSYIATLINSVIWWALIVLILLHIEATFIMWAVFLIGVPLRIGIELITKKIVRDFNEVFEELKSDVVCDALETKV